MGHFLILETSLNHESADVEGECRLALREFRSTPCHSLDNLLLVRQRETFSKISITFDITDDTT